MKKASIFILFLLILGWSCIQTPPNYGKTAGTTKLSCPWNCGLHWLTGDKNFYIKPIACEKADVMVAKQHGEFKGSVYYNKKDWQMNSIAWHGLRNYDALRLTTGIGWTGRRVAYSKYCEQQWIFAASNANSIRYGQTKRLSFTMKKKWATKRSYRGKKLKKVQWKYVSLSWDSTTSTSYTTKKVTTPSFNSPYIYFENAPETDITVSLSSQLNGFTASPAFTNNNSWDATLSNDTLVVDGEQTDNLFYEVELNNVKLNRNGQNFASKEALLDFLKNGDFYENMWMNAIQKENSLAYLEPKLTDAQNYYLTVLSDRAIENISSLDISVEPTFLERKYFAVYPTDSAVTTSWGIQYPENIDTWNAYSVLEAWEIIIDSDMFVLWEK